MPDSNTDEVFLSRALDLARQGVGLTSPNPRVGAVIVDAKGAEAHSFYQKYGFIQFSEHPLKLFIPMKVIKNLFEKDFKQ